MYYLNAGVDPDYCTLKLTIVSIRKFSSFQSTNLNTKKNPLDRQLSNCYDTYIPKVCM